MKNEELHSKILGLVSLIGLMGLWGCSSDETATPMAGTATVELQSYVTEYEEANGTNRAYDSLCITSPERSFGSNHVAFGGMIFPLSAMSIICCIETG